MDAHLAGQIAAAVQHKTPGLTGAIPTLVTAQMLGGGEAMPCEVLFRCFVFWGFYIRKPLGTRVPWNSKKATEVLKPT